MTQKQCKTPVPKLTRLPSKGVMIFSSITSPTPRSPGGPLATRRSQRLDRRLMFRQMGESVASQSTHNMGIKKRKAPSSQNPSITLIKERVNRDLVHFLSKLPLQNTAKSAQSRLRDIANDFLQKKPHEIGSDVDYTRDIIQEIIQINKTAENNTDKELGIRLLFIISPCSRHKENNEVETWNTPERRRKQRSPQRSSKTTTPNRAQPHTQPEKLEDLSQDLPIKGGEATPLPLTKAIASFTNDFPNEGHTVTRPRSTSMPQKPKTYNKPILCRICERSVPGHLFKSHTELCNIKVQWEIRAIECDQYLNTIHKTITRVKKSLTKKDSQKSGSSISSSSTRSKKSSTSDGSCCSALHNEIDLLYTISKKVKDHNHLYQIYDSCKAEIENVKRQLQIKEVSKHTQKLLLVCDDLVNWISYSQEATNNILQASALMKTFIGVFNTETQLDLKHRTVITIQKPKITDFQILKPITKGGFARVYLAKKKSSEDYFAFKVLAKNDIMEKTQVENVLVERNILASTSCPFVVRLYYSFQTQENLFLAMEFLNGGDLFSLLDAVGCFSIEMARFYIAECVLALEYLHERGIIHRDLKPDNLLINNKGHLKLTDFGLSHSGLHKQATQYLSEDKVESKQFVGTPDYLAPEVLLGLPHSYTVDWWALGVLLYEFLTGIPPFGADTVQDIFNNIIAGDIEWPEIPSEMSFEAQDLIRKLLMEDPQERLGAKGPKEVKEHPFFAGIAWDTLLTHSVPPFVPSNGPGDDISYFEAREQYWPLIEEDFGAMFDATSGEAQEQFYDFWCINVKNLKERNLELIEGIVPSS